MLAEPAAPSEAPPSPYAPRPFRVTARHSETSDTVTLEIEPATPERAPGSAWAPGQFNMLYAWAVGECAISIGGGDAAGTRFVHTIRRAGRVSEALARLAPGEAVGVRGPYGRGWPIDRARGRDIVVVAGGLGLPPLRPVIERVFAERAAFGRLEVICGARTPADLVYYGELQRWRLRPDGRVQVTVDGAGRDWYGDVGLVTARLPDARFEPATTSAFLCGPEIMMRKTAEALEARGVPGEAIFLSMERNMKCAIAQCGHCQFGPSFVCREGPVYSYAELRPFLRTREL